MGNSIVDAPDVAVVIDGSTETTMSGEYLKNPGDRGIEIGSGAEATTIRDAKFVDVSSDGIRNEGADTYIAGPRFRNHTADGAVRLVSGGAVVRDVFISDSDTEMKIRVPSDDNRIFGLPAEDAIQDGGANNSWEGQGQEAAGSSNSPTAANWSVGDVVENTDDGTLWVKKQDGGWTQIS